MDEENKEHLDAEVQDGEGDDTENNDSESTDEDTEESSEQEDDKYLGQKRRAEKAEAKAKELEERLSKLEKSEDKEEEKEEKTEQSSTLTRDEAILYAKGFEEEEVDKMRKVAQVEDIPLQEAAKSDIFTTWKANRDKEQQRQEAQMGASRGSGKRKKVDTTTPDLPKDEHKRLWKEKVGQ